LGWRICKLRRKGRRTILDHRLRDRARRPPRLHTAATEETQYIIAGTGELCMEDGKFPVGPGSVFVLPTNVRHDLANTGGRHATHVLSAAMFT
jgi:mannose-6-phosphate isomerase-like protein (cupin superfamily)